MVICVQKEKESLALENRSALYMISSWWIFSEMGLSVLYIKKSENCSCYVVNASGGVMKLGLGYWSYEDACLSSHFKIITAKG